MNFFSNVLNSIPVVGHVKAGVHYLAGDEEGGHRALYQSTRTSAVMAGGAAGLVLGPAGAAVGAAYGGLATDLLASGVSGKPQGVVQNCENVGKDIAAGRNPIGSIASTGFQVALDGVGGLGMGGVSSAASQISEKAVANSIQNVGKKVVSTVGEKALQKTFQVSASEATKAIGKTASENVVRHVIKQTALAAEVALVSTHVAKTASKQTEQDEEEERERREQERRDRERRERREREERERREREERERREREERERRVREERERREREERERCETQERERRVREERERREREERERRETQERGGRERERQTNEERERHERHERERRANEEREHREQQERERRANEELESRERQERERQVYEREQRQRRECETDQHGSQRNKSSQTSQGNKNNNNKTTVPKNTVIPITTVNQQSTNQGTSSGSSQPPQGTGNNNNTNKKKRKTDQEILDEFLQLLRRLLHNIYGSGKETISAMFSKSKLAKHRKNFVKVLRTLENFDTLEAVLETVIKIFKNHMSTDICFENFLSMLELVRSYLNGRIDEIQTESTRYTEGSSEERRALILRDIRREEDLVENVVALFQQLKAEIQVECPAPKNIASDFCDIFVKLNQYYGRIPNQQEQNKANQQATSQESSLESLQPPQGKNNKKKKKRKTDQKVLDEFLQLLQRLLRNIYDDGKETISAMFSKSELSKDTIRNDLIKVLRTLDNFDISEAVLETVIKMFKNYMSTDISFVNFLSLLDFVRSYLNDKIDKVQTESVRYTEGSYKERRAQILRDIRSEEDLIEDIIALLERLKTPDFRDIFAKIYHYYKHRRIPDLPNYEKENIQVPDDVKEYIPEDGILSVRQYFYWARTLLERLMSMPRYKEEVENQPPPITCVYQIYMVLFGYRFRVVVKVRRGPGGIPVFVMSTVFIDDSDYEGDAENGYEDLDIEEK